MQRDEFTIYCYSVSFFIHSGLCGNTSFYINEIGVIRLGHFGIGKRILTYTRMIPVWP